jgi:protocatechuate 3,4-dioxygenase, beta subunit
MLSRRMFLLSSTSVPFWPLPSLGSEGALPECEWCGASEAPGNLTSLAVLAGPDEPGERLVLRGTVLAPDGVTPVRGVLLYAYNTNAAGIYPKRGNDTGNGRRHGYLRGWLISDEQGRFEIRTILPGHYPGRDSPRHIHMTVTEPGRPEYWISDVNFEGDPRLTKEMLARRSGRGGPGVVATSRGTGGELIARRDVILEKPGYLK